MGMGMGNVVEIDPDPIQIPGEMSMNARQDLSPIRGRGLGWIGTITDERGRTKGRGSRDSGGTRQEVVGEEEPRMVEEMLGVGGGRVRVGVGPGVEMGMGFEEVES